jgi:hypothetical protein
VRDGLRAFLVVLISATLFSLGGWPFASQAVSLVGVFIALSANTPNPRAFAASAVIAMPIAALLAGVTEFVILDGVDQFPLLAIGMAPGVLAAALVSTIPDPRLASIAALVLVFFPAMLAPTNPQSYNPDTYLFFSFMAITSAILVFVLLRIVLPTSDALRRRFSPLTTMNAVTTCVRLSTSSDARRLCDGSGQRSPNCPLARAGAWLGTDIPPWSPVTPLACAAPPPISRPRQPSSIMMVRQKLARPAWI